MRKNEWKALTILIGGVFLVYILFYNGPHNPDNVFFQFSFRQGYMMAGTLFVSILMEIFAPSEHVERLPGAPTYLIMAIKRGVVSTLIYFAACMIFWALYLFW